jgi:hypothetical protein
MRILEQPESVVLRDCHAGIGIEPLNGRLQVGVGTRARGGDCEGVSEGSERDNRGHGQCLIKVSVASSLWDDWGLGEWRRSRHGICVGVAVATRARVVHRNT